MLPFGIGLAALMLLRLVLMLAGMVSAHPVDVIITLGSMATAAWMIRVGWRREA